MRSVEGYDVNEALGDCRDSTGVLEYSAHTQNSTVHTQTGTAQTTSESKSR